MKIREEQPADREKIWEINRDAFESETEASLVNTLRNSGCAFISLVAELDSRIVGHILFTPVELSGDKHDLRILGLAPMAVSPQEQNKGVGSHLVRAGLEHCEQLGYDAVVVLGHPQYYPRFGFVPAVKYGIKSEYDVPDDVFMIIELSQDCLNDHQGAIKYQPAFNEV